MSSTPTPPTQSAPVPDPGSFRDPDSRVWIEHDAVLRRIGPGGRPAVERLLCSAFFAGAVERGDLVPARSRTVDGDLELVHPLIAPWSYPSEWTFSMVRDAALLTLRLADEALDDGLLMQDASAYNVTFVGHRPVFVDHGSFVLRRDGEPWPAHQQFCQHFLHPLLVQAHADVDLQPLLRGSVEGIPAHEAWRLLGARSLARRGVALHVALPALASRRFERSARTLGTAAARTNLDADVLHRTFAGLRTIIEGLRWNRHRSTWSDYGSRDHYGGASLERKEAFVRQALRRSQPDLVLDVGCNDGRFSRIAAEEGAGVVAIDSDHLAVDRLREDLAINPAASSILPLVVDLADPTPAHGWRGTERPAFDRRFRPNFALLLAVVHHLAISRTIPFAQQAAWLAELGCDAVVEVPSERDPKVQELVAAKRGGAFPSYSLAAFEQSFHHDFEVVARELLPGGTRTLFHLSPRARTGA